MRTKQQQNSPNAAFYSMKFWRIKQPRVPHISPVFGEMWVDAHGGVTYPGVIFTVPEVPLA